MKQIPCCLYPTTVAFIDDDLLFLQNISAERDFKNLPYVNFSDPNLALKHINEDQYIKSFLAREVEYTDKYGYGEESLNRYIGEIIKQIFNADRYKQISVAVIDYAMPAMDGLEVCRAIDNKYVKKILLTGVADENLAISAFNEGLIYQFIRKHDPDYHQKLNKAIEDAQNAYFCEVFQVMLKAFEYLAGASALLDPTFIEYFNKLLIDNNIKEYYLVEPTGTFFMVDEANKSKSLFVMTEDMLDTFLPDEPTKYLDEENFKMLQERELMFCFYEPFYEQPFDSEKNEVWQPYLKKPEIIKGKQDYFTYYGDNLIKLPQEKIKFYKA